MLRILRIIAGVLLVIIGLAALVTPLTPGAWLGFIGLELLGFGFLIPRKIRLLWKKSWIPGPFSEIEEEIKEDKNYSSRPSS